MTFIDKNVTKMHHLAEAISVIRKKVETTNENTHVAHPDTALVATKSNAAKNVVQETRHAAALVTP